MDDFFIPTPKQQYAFRFNGSGKRVFFGGAKGGGKSAFAVYAALRTAIQHPGIKIVIIRKNYRELSDQIVMTFLNLFPSRIFGYRYTEKHQQAKFNNGSVIMFRAIETLKDVDKVWGVEFQLMFIDEANLFEEVTLKKMFLSLRGTNIEGYIPTLYMTGNPGGISDLYFKTRFVFKDITKWDANERLLEDKHVYIPASVYDNPHIGQDYIENLEALDDYQRAAWLQGDWTSFEGQFLENWDEMIHVLPAKDFEIPEGWRRIGGLDFGLTEAHPTVFVILAQDPDNYQTYIVAEYVNWGGDCGVYIGDIADICNEYDVEMVYADPAMWGDKRGRYGESSYTMFEAEGVPMEPSNNSRINGWRVVKRWLEYERLPDKIPLLRVLDTCSKTIETAPMLRYATRGMSREDCDSRGPDDAWDAIRYALVRGFYYPSREDIEVLSMLDVDRMKREAMYKQRNQTSYDHIGVAAYYG